MNIINFNQVMSHFNAERQRESNCNSDEAIPATADFLCISVCEVQRVVHGIGEEQEV